MSDNDKDRFVEELLDASLKRYRSEEPRTGLENRILANVRASERARRRRGLWVWALAASAAVAIIAAGVYIPRRRSVPTPSPQQSLVSKAGAPTPVIVAPRTPFPPSPRRQPARQAVAKRRRPEQFPTPAPLSEEEKLLLAHASQVPRSDLDNLINLHPKAEPLEIPGLKIAMIEIKQLPKLNE